MPKTSADIVVRDIIHALKTGVREMSDEDYIEVMTVIGEYAMAAATLAKAGDRPESFD